MSGKDYDTHQVARMFNVDQRTVRKWIKKGKLQAYRTPGGQWRVPKKAMEKRSEA